MHFPSLWLIVLFAIAPFIVGGFLGSWAMRRDPLFGQRRLSESGLYSLAGFMLTPAWFFALTGSFPTTYALGGAGLYILTGVALWFALRAAGLPRNKRVVQTTCLDTALMKPPHVLGGCLLLLVILALYLAFTIVAFGKAKAVNLGSADGLFAVALWVFTIPPAVFFALGNVMRLLNLVSAETPQQTRVQSFATALRDYVLSAWSIGYPFIAFHRNTLAANPRWIVLGVVAYAVAYLVFVVLPYGVGRTRFIERSKEVLEKLDDAASRIIIATEREVSDAYQVHILERARRDLQELIVDVVKERPFFRYYLDTVSRQMAAFSQGLTSTETPLALPAPNAPPAEHPETPGRWDKIISDHGPQMPEWDYRMYLIAQVQEILEHPGDKGWLRGAGLATRIAVARWLNRNYARSVVLGSLGVAASALFALGLQAFQGELMAAAQSLADTIAAGAAR
jgi:hypothetical protein